MIALSVAATGRAAGKTNITLAATDGSGKKVICAVNVCNPVTKVHISSSTKTTQCNHVTISNSRSRSDAGIAALHFIGILWRNIE